MIVSGNPVRQHHFLNSVYHLWLFSFDKVVLPYGDLNSRKIQEFLFLSPPPIVSQDQFPRWLRTNWNKPGHVCTANDCVFCNQRRNYSLLHPSLENRLATPPVPGSGTQIWANLMVETQIPDALIQFKLGHLEKGVVR